MILKNKIKIYISALTILLLFSLGIRSINADELMELKLNKNNIELAVGSSYQLKAIDREHAGSKIQWKSDNTDIVIVTLNGKLKAKKSMSPLNSFRLKMKKWKACFGIPFIA